MYFRDGAASVPGLGAWPRLVVGSVAGDRTIWGGGTADEIDPQPENNSASAAAVLLGARRRPWSDDLPSPRTPRARAAS